ncbi:MAG: hypothetical protein ACTSPB_01465 [Candidatus Thorarchaeota archaeon]
MNWLFFLRWWYCRWWHYDDKWLNYRDKIVHLVFMAGIMFWSLKVSSFWGFNKTGVIFTLFNLGLLKEARDYFIGWRHEDDPTNLFYSNIEIIFDILSNVLGMVFGWVIFHNYGGIISGWALISMMGLTYFLHNIHFDVEGNNALVFNRLYILDDYPIPSGKVEGKEDLLYMWAENRIVAFHKWLSDEYVKKWEKEENGRT